MSFDTAVPPFCLLLIKQFFTPKKEHQTLLISLLIPLRGCKHPLIFSARLRLDYENFDSRFAFAQDDMLTLETHCHFGTLSKRGR